VWARDTECILYRLTEGYVILWLILLANFYVIVTSLQVPVRGRLSGYALAGSVHISLMVEIAAVVYEALRMGEWPVVAVFKQAGVVLPEAVLFDRARMC